MGRAVGFLPHVGMVTIMLTDYPVLKVGAPRITETDCVACIFSEDFSTNGVLPDDLHLVGTRIWFGSFHILLVPSSAPH